MKKILFLLVVFLSLPAFCGEPLMLINPSRETFINFPSAVLDMDKTVTVFLPEKTVPLKGRYPVVYLLGAIPKDAPAAEALLAASQRKALLVGVNFEESDYAHLDKIVRFMTRELIPYINVNYSVFDDPSSRAVVSGGEAAAKVTAALLAQKDLFGRAVILNGGEPPASLDASAESLRVILAGERPQVFAWQQVFERKGLAYGPEFVTKLGVSRLLEAVNLDYLFAPSEELILKKLRGDLFPRVLVIGGEETVSLSVSAVLANAMTFDYLPSLLKISPMYLDWNGKDGILSVIPGALPGKVKISVLAGKTGFSGKIKLKK